MNSFHYTEDLVNVPNTPKCVHYIWVNFMDNIEVYSFKTHKEATKFVDFIGANGNECGYFESFKLNTFLETQSYCENQDFDDNNTLWDVVTNKHPL